MFYNLQKRQAPKIDKIIISHKIESFYNQDRKTATKVNLNKRVKVQQILARSDKALKLPLTMVISQNKCVT